MKLTQRLFGHPIFQRIACFLIFLYAKFVFLTSRWEHKGKENIEELSNSQEAFIFVLWHNRLMLSPFFAPKKRQLHAVISQHKDGEYVARFMEFLGIKQIRGSSKKGAVSALKGCMQVLKQQDVLVITPDGPRGPRMKLGGNVVTFAQKSGVPIVPFAYATSRCKIFKTWDRFILPYPFGSGSAIYGKPIYIPKKLDEKALIKTINEVEQQLNNVTEEADKLAGNQPIKP
jgi:lysophospholipid acyltransferase (LPLAT)-like uncharacterized protein